MTPVSHGKPCAGNPHARFEEGASAPEEPRRKALLHFELFGLFDLTARAYRYTKCEASRITKRRAGRVRFGTAVRTFGATNHKFFSTP